MTTEAHLDAAITDLQRAKATLRTNPAFAGACITDARLAIAAASVDLKFPADALAVRIVKGLVPTAA